MPVASAKTGAGIPVTNEMIDIFVFARPPHGTGLVSMGLLLNEAA